MSEPTNNNGIKTLIELGAPVAFALVYFTTKDFITATIVLIVGSLLAVIVGFITEKKLAVMPLVTAGAAIFFGALTVIFKDPTILKLKLTILYTLFALILLGGMVFKKLFLKMVLGQAIRLKEGAWPTLTYAYAGFFISVAILNEIIWRTQTEAFWVWFKTSLFFVFLGFSIALTPFMMKNWVSEKEEEPKPETLDEKP